MTAVASIGQNILSAAHDKTLRLWDADSGKQINQYYPEKEFESAVRSILPIDAQHFVTGGSDFGVFRLWHVEKGHVRRFEGIRFWATDFARLDGSCIAMATRGYCDVDVWDLERAERLHRCSGHESVVNTVAVLDAKHGYPEPGKSIGLWTLEPGSRLERFKGLDWWISGYAILPSGSIVSASWNGDVTLWDGSSGAEICRSRASTKDGHASLCSMSGASYLMAFMMRIGRSGFGMWTQGKSCTGLKATERREGCEGPRSNPHPVGVR